MIYKSGVTAVRSPRITSPPAQRWEAPLPSLRRQLGHAAPLCA